MHQEPARVAEAMWEAATTVGFFTVVNHGVPEPAILHAFEASRAFFARDLDAKHAECAAGESTICRRATDTVS